MESAKERSEVIEFIKGMKLKSKAIGGADRDDVFEKIKGLTEIYEGIISKEEIEQQAVINRLEQELAKKEKKLEEKAIEEALVNGDRVIVKGYDNGSLDERVKQLENEKSQLLSEKEQLIKELEKARAQIQLIKNGDINADTSSLDAERARVKALIFEAREKAASLLKETKVKAEELVNNAKTQSQELLGNAKQQSKEIIDKATAEAQEQVKNAQSARELVSQTSEKVKQLKAEADAYGAQSLKSKEDAKKASDELVLSQKMLNSVNVEYGNICQQKQKAQEELEAIQVKLNQMRDMFGFGSPQPVDPVVTQQPQQPQQSHSVEDVFENPKYSDSHGSIDDAIASAKASQEQPVDDYDSDVATPEDFALFEDELAKYDEELSRLESMSTL